MKNLCSLLFAATTLMMCPLTLHAASNSSSNKTSSETTTTTTTTNAFWVGVFEEVEDGAICVRLDQVASVTIHNYILNGTIPITELTIDTTGNNSIRVYSIINGLPLNEEARQTVAEMRAVAHETKKIPQVAKQYPQSTHTHSIEYSVTDATQITKIYQSLTSAMSSNKSTKISIRK